MIILLSMIYPDYFLFFDFYLERLFEIIFHWFVTVDIRDKDFMGVFYLDEMAVEMAVEPPLPNGSYDVSFF